MKKITRNLLLLLLALVMLFVSCEGPDKGETVGLVRFVDTQSRSLTASFSFKAEDYYWKYEARKLEVPQLNIGATSGQTSVSPLDESGKPSGKGLGFSVGPFSAGSWEFKLYAYKYSSCLEEELVFQGTTNAVIQQGQNNPIKVEVTPADSKVIKDWILEVQNNIPIVDSQGQKIDVTGAEGWIICKSLDDPEAALVSVKLGTKANRTTSVSLAPGNYDIYVEYVEKNSRTVVASGSVSATLHSNIKTYVTGTIPQGTGTGAFIASNTKYETLPGGAVEAKAEVPVVAAKPTVLQVASSPVESKTMDKLTSVELPADSITGKSAEISIKPDGKVAVSTDTATVASIDINLTVDGQAQTSFNGQKATVSTYIQPGIEGAVSVLYDGVALPAEDVSYDSVTGLLVFKTTHFSVYTVTADDAVVVNKTTGKVYGDLKDAASYRELDQNNVNEIVLLKDIATNKSYDFEYDTVLDLNGHVITDTMTNKSMFAIFSCERDGDLTITGNGTVIASGKRYLFEVGNSYDDPSNGKAPTLTVENGTFKTADNAVVEKMMMYFNPSSKNTAGVTVNLNGGTFTWDGIAIQGQGQDVSRSALNIADGVSITGNWYLPNMIDVTINGGTFSADATVIYQKAGSLTLNGGRFESTENDVNIGKHLYWGNGCISTGDAIVIEASNYGNYGEPTLKGTGAEAIISNTGRDGVVVLNLTNASGTHKAATAEYVGKYFANDAEYRPATVSIKDNSIANWNEAVDLKTILSAKNDKWDGSVTSKMDIEKKVVKNGQGASIDISNAPDLAGIMANVSDLSADCYPLTINITGSINLDGGSWTPARVVVSEVVINGNNNTLTNMNCITDGNAGFIGTVGGGGKVTINDLSIEKATVIGDENDVHASNVVAAFVAEADGAAMVTVSNCSLLDSTVKGGHWVGGIVGTASGYNVLNNGPVFLEVTVDGCTVRNTEISGKGSAGGVTGHATRNAWTKFTINAPVMDTVTVASTGSSTDKAGSLIGTVGVAGTESNGKTGGVYVTDISNVKNVTATSGSASIDRIYGRVGSAGGKLYLDGKLIASL